MHKLPVTIGDKIRNYRKRSQMSQLDLETAIGTSAGSVSRIEGGKVNPTKETVMSISKELNLSTNELNDLLEIRPLFPAPEEIQAAITEVREYLDDPKVFGYLLDEYGNCYFLSQGFKEAVHLSQEQFAKLQGINIFQLITDPSLGINQYLDQEHLPTTLTLEIARAVREGKIDNFDLFQPLLENPTFKQLWEASKQLPDSEVFSPKNKVAYFNFDGKVEKWNYSRERLKQNTRFEIVEYYQANQE